MSARPLLHRLASTWLPLVDGTVGLILLGALLAPLCDAAGLPELSDRIHFAYLLLCPQRPEHSYFLLGYQLALEHREIAMLVSLLLGSALYRVRRAQKWKIPLWLMLVASLPMLWDVLSQAAGLRESDWFTRTWTAGLFTLTYVFWLYPALDQLARPTPSRARVST